MSRRIIVTLLGTLLTASMTAQVAPPPTQTPPRDPTPTTRPQPGTARIQGRVVQADTSTPIRRASLELTGDQVSRRRVTTDDQGRYEFGELPSGQFRITVSRGGYLTMQYGQRRPFEPGRTLTLASGQQLSQVNFALPRASAINGRITDRLGEPVVGADVRVQRYQYSSDGERRLTNVPLSLPTPMQTNDLGEFRVFGLMPGSYVVSALLRERTAPALIPGDPASVAPSRATYVQTYSPGTAIADEAQEIVVGIGQEASTQFQLVTGRMSRLSGRIIDSSGQPAANADLGLATRTGWRAVGYAGPDGSFAIANVAPGEHFVQAWLPSRGDGGRGIEMANVPVTASEESVDNLVVTTTPALTANGRVEWQGSTPRTAQNPFLITAVRADGISLFRGPTRAREDRDEGLVGTDDTFRLSSLQGTLRLSVTGVPPGWIVKSITAGNTDVLVSGADASTLAAAPIRIVLTDRVSTLSGTARNAKNEPATDYSVVIMPADAMDPRAASRLTHVAQSDQKGAFRVSGLAPGRYVAVAVEAIETGGHLDPAFQAGARNDSRAQRVTFEEGQALTLTLELLP